MSSSGKGKGSPQGAKSPGALGSPFQFSAKAVAASKPKQNVLQSSQTKFLALLDALNDQDLMEFREFVREELEFPDDGNNDVQITDEMLAKLKFEGDDVAAKNDQTLIEIIQFLRKALPTSALAEDETLKIPKGEHYDGFTETNTVHVDEFLYTEEEADELVDAGLLSRDYCCDCGSRNIKPLNFISHSFPREVIRWLFAAALPNIKGKVVVDVGSRLGPVLWMGYLFSHAKELVGIELNKTFASLAQQIVSEFKFGDRIKIIQGNMLEQGNVLQTADVVVLNNVFEWFSDPSELSNLWNFVTKNINKKGTIVVTIPSIEESLKNAAVKIDISKWAKPMEVRYPEPPPHDHDDLCDDDDEDPFFENCRQVHLYQVL